MTTKDDDRPPTSEEMIRRAREGLSRPMESIPRAEEAKGPPPVPAPTKATAKSPRLRPPPRPTPLNPAATRLVVAIAVIIALIGAGIAVLAMVADSAP